MAANLRVLMGVLALIYLGGSLLPYLPPSVAHVVAICLDLAILCLDFIFWRAVFYLWRSLLPDDPSPLPQVHRAVFLVWRRRRAPAAVRNSRIASILNNAEAPPDFRCAICLANRPKESEAGPSPVVMLVCGHYFCRECITIWLADRHNTCPLCRRRLFNEPRVSVPVYRGVVIFR